MPSTAADSHDTVIRVYDEVGNVIETQRAQGRFQGVVSEANKKPPRGEVRRLIVGSTITEVRGYDTIPFLIEEISDITVTHRKWEFRR